MHIESGLKSSMNWNIRVSALDSRVHHNKALSIDLSILGSQVGVWRTLVYQYFSLYSSVLRICGDQPVQMPSIERRQPERVAQPLRGAGRWPRTTRWRRFRKDMFRQSPQRLGPAKKLEECNVKRAHIRTNFRMHLQIDTTHVSFHKKVIMTSNI